MFAHNPELKEIFNMSNQRNGDQREALFAIAAYASNLENLPALLPAVEKIAQKHQLPDSTEQYNIVGTHLLATLDEMFSPGREVLDAGARPTGCWPASLLIVKRKSITKRQQNRRLGRHRAFRIVKNAAR